MKISKKSQEFEFIDHLHNRFYLKNLEFVIKGAFIGGVVGALLRKRNRFLVAGLASAFSCYLVASQDDNEWYA